MIPPGATGGLDGTCWNWLSYACKQEGKVHGQRYSSRIRALRAKPSRAGNEGYFWRGSILTDFPRTSAVRT